MSKIDIAQAAALPEPIRKEIGETLRRHAAELRLLARKIDPPPPRTKKPKYRCADTQDWVAKMTVEDGAYDPEA